MTDAKWKAGGNARGDRSSGCLARGSETAVDEPRTKPAHTCAHKLGSRRWGETPEKQARERLARITELEAEVAELRTSVIAFGAPWAVDFAQNCGLPRGHLHPTHYDILARAGARMDDFVRGEAMGEAPE